MPSIKVAITRPLCARWTDEVVKRRLAAEMERFGSYGHADVLNHTDAPRHIDGHDQPSTSSYATESTEVIQARITQNLEKQIAVAQELARDFAIFCSRQNVGSACCSDPPPQSSPYMTRENQDNEMEDDDRDKEVDDGDEEVDVGENEDNDVQNEGQDSQYKYEVSEKGDDDGHKEHEGVEKENEVREKEDEDAEKEDEPHSAQSVSISTGLICIPSSIESPMTSFQVANPTIGSQSHANSPTDDVPNKEDEIQIICEGEGGNQSTKAPIDCRYKRTAKRLVKRATIYKSPFVAHCVKHFPKIAHTERVIADLALDSDGDPNEVLCDMFGMFITRAEMACLTGTGWLNSVVLTMVCRKLNAQQPRPPHRHYFDPTISVMLSSLPFKAKKDDLVHTFHAYLDPNSVGYDISQCDLLFFPICYHNHWHVHVIDIGASRVEILSSLPLTRGNKISALSKRLSNAIDRAFHANSLLTHLEVAKFEHVQPDIVQQKNEYDCGIFVVQYMEHWNGATLAEAVAEEKMHLYRLKLLVSLIMDEENKAREKLMQGSEC